MLCMERLVSGQTTAVMNCFFSTIAEKLNVGQLQAPQLLTSPCSKPVLCISDINLSSLDFGRKITLLKNNKATGPDGISPTLLKLAGRLSFCVSFTAKLLSSRFRRPIFWMNKCVIRWLFFPAELRTSPKFKKKKNKKKKERCLIATGALNCMLSSEITSWVEQSWRQDVSLSLRKFVDGKYA